MRPRIQQEFAQLRDAYGDVEHVEQGGEDWFLLPRYGAPHGTRVGEEEVETIPLAFRVKPNYPAGAPYAFLVPRDITLSGSAPRNASAAPSAPFPGAWLQVSWQPVRWEPTNDVRKGSNLLVWCRSFATRLEEGA